MVRVVQAIKSRSKCKPFHLFFPFFGILNTNKYEFYLQCSFSIPLAEFSSIILMYDVPAPKKKTEETETNTPSFGIALTATREQSYTVVLMA